MNADDGFKYKPSSDSKSISKEKKASIDRIDMGLSNENVDHAIRSSSTLTNSKLQNRPPRGNDFTFQDDTSNSNSNSNSNSISNSNINSNGNSDGLHPKPKR